MQRLPGASDGADAHDNPLAAAADDFAHHTIQRLHKKMQRRAEATIDEDEHAVHRLRIAGKRARYAVEFFSSLYKPRSAKRFLDTLSEMQDALGLHNDVVVAERLLRELQDHHPHAGAAIGYARGYLQAQQACEASNVADFRLLVRLLRPPRRA
ncbi:MAG: CHAD domain-containing protein, partial [Paucibacter sp.]|nr:CHAD domain-containing protein [Roseateles sp.]